MAIESPSGVSAKPRLERGLPTVAAILSLCPLVFTGIQWVAASVCTAEVGEPLRFEIPGREYTLSSFAQWLDLVAWFTMVLSPLPIVAAPAVVLVALGSKRIAWQRAVLLAGVLMAGIAAWYGSREWSATFSGYIEWSLD